MTSIGDKLSNAYQALQAKLKNRNSVNIYSSDADSPPFSADGVPCFKGNPGFKMEDFIKEFKDFYKQETGNDFSEKEAGEKGYSFQKSKDAHGNEILQLTCPDPSLRNKLIQRLLDKNMMHSAVPALKEEAGASDKKQSSKDSSPILSDDAPENAEDEPVSSLPAAFNPRATPSLKPSDDGPTSSD